VLADLRIRLPDGTTMRLADTSPDEIWRRAMRLRD
jgi:hypothetical protein